MTDTIMSTSKTERIVVLDALRGFALIGIFLANIRGFSGWEGLSDQAQITLAGSVAQRFTDFFHLMLINGKFYTLFSFLFGIGFSLQISRLKIRGIDIKERDITKRETESQYNTAINNSNIEPLTTQPQPTASLENGGTEAGRSNRNENVNASLSNGYKRAMAWLDKKSAGDNLKADTLRNKIKLKNIDTNKVIKMLENNNNISVTWQGKSPRYAKFNGASVLTGNFAQNQQ